MGVSTKKVAMQRILIVRSSEHDYEQLMDAFGQSASVQFANSFDEAVERIGKEQFDLVLSDTSNFVPLEKALVAQQASTVLEAIDQWVCVVDREGKFVWSNQQLNEVNEELRVKIVDCCLELLAAQWEADIDPASILRTRHFSLSASKDFYYEVTAAPIMTADGEIGQVAAIVADVTPARRLQRRINAIDQAGREVMRLDAQQVSKLDVSERLTLLEEKIIRFARDIMHFSNFAIYVLDKNTNKLELLINYDLPPEAAEIDLYASTEGNGITGYVATTGRSYICPDVRKDPRYLPGIVEARSSLNVPLKMQDEVMGVLNVESDQPAAFTEDDRQFAAIFCRYIAIALNTFDLLITERAATTGKLANNVQIEIAAPLNDIITDATTLMEDYIGHDDLRRRLQAICDNVMKAKQSVKDVAAPTRGLLGSKTPTLPHDPVLTGKIVLVADDEDAIRDTIAEVLLSYGCDVETAHDGVQAVSMLAERSYDLVLTDIKMPGKNGYEVFAAAKNRNADCPVILMTGFGYDPNHSIIRARQEGLSAVLFKPFKVDQLINELRSAIGAKTTS